MKVWVLKVSDGSAHEGYDGLVHIASSAEKMLEWLDRYFPERISQVSILNPILRPLFQDPLEPLRLSFLLKEKPYLSFDVEEMDVDKVYESRDEIRWY